MSLQHNVHVKPPVN